MPADTKPKPLTAAKVRAVLKDAGFQASEILRPAPNPRQHYCWTHGFYVVQDRDRIRVTTKRYTGRLSWAGLYAEALRNAGIDAEAFKDVVLCRGYLPSKDT